MSIPVDSVHHIEDVGHLLLEAQKDLARVRQRLEAMPLESNQTGPSSAFSNDTIESLRDILNKTESNLRVKAEAVLKSVEENKINTLPILNTQPMRYQGDFTLSSVVVQPENAIVPTRLTSPTGSPVRRSNATALASQQAYMRRPVVDRMQEARAMELMSRPMESAIMGGVARDFVNTRYGVGPTGPPAPPAPSYAPPSASISVTGTRPIERYGRNWRDTKVVRGPLTIPSILHKSIRKNPGRFPSIGPNEADQGVLNLVQKGFIPSFVDVTSAFTSTPAPLQQAPATFHNYADQFKRQQQQVATHGFNLTQVKLDLGEVLLDRDTMNEYELGLLARDEEKTMPQLTSGTNVVGGGSQSLLQPLAATNFEFPQLMPGEDEAAAARQQQQEHDVLTLHGREDIDDLLTSNVDSDDHLQQVNIGGPRDYDELLDTYSLHQFLIRKGKVLSSTPEFQSFSRRNHLIWGGIREILRDLESLSRDLHLTLITISGNRVVQLSEKMSPHLQRPTREELFQCFLFDTTNTNDPIVKSLLTTPSRVRYSMGGETARTLAAMKIQSTWRMYLQRRLYLSYRFRHSKAILIQRAWRRFQTILKTRSQILEGWEQRYSSWTLEVQEPWKKNWSNWNRKRRVYVHIPSISKEPYQRQNIFNFAVRENAQLSRLCDILDPNIDVLYLCPFHLSMDIQSYYLKLLEVGLNGNGNGSSTNNLTGRVKILIPENIQKFPEYFSLTKQTLYSPKVLKKIRTFIRGRPACIIPNEVGMEDLQLAVELGLPLYGGLPELGNIFGSKSGSKRIFAASEVNVPPGAHDIYDEQDFYSYLAKLIVDHLSIGRWFFKIDNESGGRGLAIIDVQHFKVIHSLRLEKQQHASRWSLPEVLANAQERVIVALRKGLPKKVVLATPTLYDGKWRNFAQAFFRVGGVIEAGPTHVIGSPSVNLLIEPDGTIQILSSHDQVFSTPFVFAGANFPSSAPSELIHQPALSIGKQCFREGIIGHLGIDFLAWHEGPGSIPKIWAVDLNLKMTPTQASFKMFDFLMKGRYVWKNNSGKDLPLHLRPSARYLVPSSSTLASSAANAVASSNSLGPQQQQHQRSSSRTGLISSNSSPSSRMFSSNTGAGAGQLSSSPSQHTSVTPSRDNSRPTSGSTTPKLPGIERKPSNSNNNNNDRGKEELRFYSCVPYLYQPHLATVQFGSFFNLCRLKGVSFDVRSRIGTVFMMMDSLASGTIGLMAIGQGSMPQHNNNNNSYNLPTTASLPPSPLHAMTILVDSLSFLNEQASSLRFGAHLYDSESNLTQMLLGFKGLVKAQREANQLMQLEHQSQLVDHQQQQQQQDNNPNF